jgi:hypothetical protein
MSVILIAGFDGFFKRVIMILSTERRRHVRTLFNGAISIPLAGNAPYAKLATTNASGCPRTAGYSRCPIRRWNRRG